MGGQCNKIKDYIKDNAIAYSIQLIHHEDIDKYNILNATMTGMHKCLDEITDLLSIDTILVDGNHFEFYSDKNDHYIDHICVVDGDNTYKSIAAASILAKTYRDDIMLMFDEDYPVYNWRKNKGYPTKAHREGIRLVGPTIHHRKSFRLLPEQLPIDF